MELLLKEIKHLFDLASDDLTDVIVQICECRVFEASQLPIHLTIFPLVLNQKGHTSYTWHVYRIHTEVSAAFYEGLNQADPLLNVVNVGSQKEAADLKIRGRTWNIFKRIYATESALGQQRV